MVRGVEQKVGYFSDQTVSEAFRGVGGEKTPTNKGNNQHPQIQSMAALFMLEAAARQKTEGATHIWDRVVPQVDNEAMVLMHCYATQREAVRFVKILDTVIMNETLAPYAGSMIDRFTRGERL